MAKMAYLDFDTIKIGNSALTGTVQGTYSKTTNAAASLTITVPDNYGNPTVVYWTANGRLLGGSGGDGSGGANLDLTVSKAGQGTLYYNSASVGRNGVLNVVWSGSCFDPNPSVPQDYSIRTTGVFTASGGSVQMSGSLLAMYFKK